MKPLATPCYIDRLMGHKCVCTYAVTINYMLCVSLSISLSIQNGTAIHVVTCMPSKSSLYSWRYRVSQSKLVWLISFQYLEEQYLSNFKFNAEMRPLLSPYSIEMTHVANDTTFVNNGKPYCTQSWHGRTPFGCPNYGGRKWQDNRKGYGRYSAYWRQMYK